MASQQRFRPFGWALALAFFASVAQAQPLPSAALDRLTQTAADRGSARVIIGLKVGDAATQSRFARLPLASPERSQRIEQVQTALETNVFRGSNARIVSRFGLQPHLAAEVDVNTLARLRTLPDVAFIEEDVAVPLALAQSTPLIGAPKAWASGTTGAGQTVAVLDTGVDKTHPMLSGKVVSEACYSSNTAEAQSLCPGQVTQSTAAGSGKDCAATISGCNHGTHVAGIVAGRDDGLGNQGVAPGADLIAIQVFSHFTASKNVMSYTSDQIRALERVYALKDIHRIAAVNMSLGGGRFTSQCDSSNLAIKAAIDNLRSVGIATVIASGNNGYANALSSPSCVSSAISVGAHCDAGPDGSACATGVGGMASYSNTASFLSLVAPGSYIRSAVPGGSYQSFNGTSMAAPHVAGAWALLRQVQPAVSVAEGLALFKSQGILLNDTRPGGTVTGLKRLQTGSLVGTPRTLTVARSGSGSGIVSSAPSGILCGGDCTEIFSDGDSVTLTALPSAGSTFEGWSGACAGTGACTVSMTGAIEVTAQFQAGSYPLTVTRSGNGSGTVSSSVPGIQCGSACSAVYSGGSTVVLTAVAAANSRFAGWSGACTGTGNCVVSTVAARSVNATFTATKFKLSVARSGTGSGSVTSQPAGISCGSTCTSMQATGSTVSLTAKAASGSKFIGWTGACKGTGTCKAPLSMDVTVGARFDKIPYTLTFTRTGSGAGLVTFTDSGAACTASCRQTYLSGTTARLSAAPDSKSKFLGWSGKCRGTGACVVPMSAAASVSANFARK